MCALAPGSTMLSQPKESVHIGGQLSRKGKEDED
jgi:hypothetical protein